MATENAWSAETSEPFQMIDAKKSLVSNKRSHYIVTGSDAPPKRKRNRQLDIIGIYHSHPDTCAIPSEFDRVYAWHQYSYIIVSVKTANLTSKLEPG